MTSPPAIWKRLSNRMVNLLDLDPDIHDFAVLADMPRFGGHRGRTTPLSVMQHSGLCWLIAHSISDSVRIHKFALLHDAHEAYIGDIPSPTKGIIKAQGDGGALSRADQELQHRVYNKFAGDTPTHLERRIVHQIDVIALVAEAKAIWPGDFMPGDDNRTRWPQCTLPSNIDSIMAQARRFDFNSFRLVL